MYHYPPHLASYKDPAYWIMASQFTPPPDGDRNRGPAVLITQGITVGIATILVVLRIIVRSKVIKELGLDDLFIVGGMVGLSSNFIFIAFVQL